MNVVVNGAETGVDDGARLDALVAKLGLSAATIAVEVNRTVVRRDRWAEVALRPGDAIEIVTLVGGG